MPPTVVTDNFFVGGGRGYIVGEHGIPPALLGHDYEFHEPVPTTPPLQASREAAPRTPTEERVYCKICAGYTTTYLTPTTKAVMFSLLYMLLVYIFATETAR